MYWSHWRCASPVVVIESDDWGMKRKQSAAMVSQYGIASDWADEEFETTSDLEDLYEVLDRFRGKNNRPPCMTANFIVANADFKSIEASGFTKYYDQFLDETEPKEIFDKYNEGIRRAVFYPQYHGRRHLATNAFLSDLKENSVGSRDLLQAGHHGGASLYKGQNWRYHSEYMDWEAGEPISTDDILKDLYESAAFFERQFGFSPKSTIAPHYIFTEEAERAWREVGIRFIQGTGYCLKRSGAQKKIRAHYMGQRSKEGLVCMTRTVKFEPGHGREKQSLSHATELVPNLIKSGVPVVIDTHRINYTGIHKKRGLIELQKLLEFVSEFDPVFLTSVELGEAIEKNGEYVDVFSGEKQSLKVISSEAREMSARLYERIHPHDAM